MLPADAELRNKILEENRRIHALENHLYLSRHPEQTNFYQRRLLRETIKTLGRCLGNPNAEILELGCGTGYLYLRLLARGYRMTGVDLSKDMIRVLEREIPVEQKNRSRLLVMDAVEFVEQDKNQYDAVALSALLHHLYDYESAILAYCAKLRPGGLFQIFFEPLKQQIDDPARYAVHKKLAGLDESIYLWDMKRQKIPLFQDNYEYSDYQRQFGGIDPDRVANILKTCGMETLEVKKYCARRYGLSAWIANELLGTVNTFNLLARKNR